MLSLLLREFHLRVTEAADGVDGLDCFLRGQFDLVITDLDMPRSNGLELAAAIKIHNPRQKVFLFTAHARELSIADLPYIDRLLPKPLTLGDLRAALASIGIPVSSFLGVPPL